MKISTKIMNWSIQFSSVHFGLFQSSWNWFSKEFGGEGRRGEAKNVSTYVNKYKLSTLFL